MDPALLAADPSTPPEVLRDIAIYYPDLRLQVMQNPSCYPELAQWIQEQTIPAPPAQPDHGYPNPTAASAAKTGGGGLKAAIIIGGVLAVATAGAIVWGVSTGEIDNMRNWASGLSFGGQVSVEQGCQNMNDAVIDWVSDFPNSREAREFQAKYDAAYWENLDWEDFGSATTQLGVDAVDMTLNGLRSVSRKIKNREVEAALNDYISVASESTAMLSFEMLTRDDSLDLFYEAMAKEQAAMARLEMLCPTSPDDLARMQSVIDSYSGNY